MLLIFIMIEPIKIIIGGSSTNNIKNNIKYTIEKGIKENSLQYENEDDNNDKYKKIQNNMIKDIFTQNIQAEIKQLIPANYNIESIDINVTNIKDKDIHIQDITMTINDNTKSDIQIKPYNETYQAKQNYIQDEVKIKNIISNFYNLSNDNIFITIT